MKKTNQTPGKAQHPGLNRRQRRVMARRIRTASTFTSGEIVKEVTEHPDGTVSVACCVDFVWPKFCRKAGLNAPERGEGMSDEEWEKEKQAYDRFVASEKNIARFWYLMGLKHHKETHQKFLGALADKEQNNPTQEG